MKLGRCHACEVLAAEIDRLRRQNDTLLDRVVTLAGRPDATREAVTPTEDPAEPPSHGHDDTGDDETDHATLEGDIFREAEEELHRMAAERGVDPATYSDV